MPRRPRNLLGDGYFHVTARGVARMRLFHDRLDYATLVGLLTNVVGRFAWACHAFCLMPNHYHLVVESSRAQLSAGMHRLNGLYAQAFNHRCGRVGHVFQNRFDARLVEGDEYLETVCRYVLENPVRAGLSNTPDDWPWSGRSPVSS